jgi:PAS domain S-box-containing protein
MLDVDPKKSQPEHVERAGAKLRQEQDQLKQIVDLIPQTIVVLNPEGKAIYANRVALEYLGLTLDQVCADDFRERVFHPEDIQRLREERANALSGAIPFETSNVLLERR